MTLRTLHVSTSPVAISASLGGFHPMLRGPAVPLSPDTEAGAQTAPMAFEAAVSLLADAEDGDADAGLLTDDGGEDEDAPDEEDGAQDGDASEDDEDEASDQEAGDEDAPDEEEPASEDDAEDEDDEPAEPVIAAPKFWSAEEKALFAKAPPELQTLIAAKDEAAEKRVYAAKEEAAAARKDASAIFGFKEIIDQQVQRAETIFQGKWDGVDFQKWASDVSTYAAKPDADQAEASRGIAEYNAALAEYQAEQLALNNLKRTQEATAETEHQQFLKAEKAKLEDPETGVPELADPVKGKENKVAIVTMLRAEGYTPEDIRWIGARELKIAWEAYQYRQLKARAAAKPKPAPEPAKVVKPKAVKPAAAPAPRKATAARKRSELFAKAVRTGRSDDAVAALMAMEG